MLVEIQLFLIDFWRLINGRCESCGGEVGECINGRFYCLDCGKEN